MLKITPDQFDTFEKKAEQDFEDELLKHLKTVFAPRHVQGLGDERVRGLIQAGLTKARSYGFTLRGSLRFYVECMIMFGHEFDTDPMLPWVAGGFSQGVRGDELAQVDQIHASAMQYRQAVFGSNDQHEAAAIRRLLKKPVDVWLQSDLSEAGILRQLQAVYPERAAQAPPDGLTTILEQSKRLVSKLAVQAPCSQGVLATLMFCFGHGVIADPQFFWIAENLDATKAQMPIKRMESLANRLLAYLAEGLKLLEQG